jgi:hypothetical protein
MLLSKITFQETVSGAGNVIDSLSQFSGVIRGLGPAGGVESPHMLHYAHELARRDVEISNLRKAKHQLESTFRKLQRAAIIEEEKHQENTNQLKEEVARLVKPHNNKNTLLYMSTLQPLRERV